MSVWRTLAWLSFLVGYGMVCLPVLVALALSLLWVKWHATKATVLEGGVPLENSRVTAFLMWYGMKNSLMDGIYHVRCPLNG